MAASVLKSHSLNGEIILLNEINRLLSILKQVRDFDVLFRKIDDFYFALIELYH